MVWRLDKLTERQIQKALAEDIEAAGEMTAEEALAAAAEAYIEEATAQGFIDG